MNRAEECLRRLAQEPLVIEDVETSGLDWKRNHIIGYVFTFGPRPEDSYYLPFRHLGGGNIEGTSIPDAPDNWRGDLHPMELEIAKIHRDRFDVLSVGHNFAFDLRFMHRHKIQHAGPLGCTMINAALLNEYDKSYSLDLQAKKHGCAVKKGEPLYEYMASVFGGEPTRKKQMGEFWKTDAAHPIVLDYTLGDGTSTWELWHKQVAEIKKPDRYGRTLEKVWGIENRVIPILNRMTCRGIRIDETRLAEVRGIAEKRKALASSKLPDGFNPNAPTQMKKLFVDAGITDWPLTVKGAEAFKAGKLREECSPSFPEQFLVKSELGRVVVAMRKYEHLLNSFILPMQDRHLVNGRVHSEYNQMIGENDYGTVTGRLSSSNPNMQQIHKRNMELGILFRSIFIPDDGMIMAENDYSQCEPRLLAYYGGIKVLLDGYKSNPPVDAHSAVAKAAGIDRQSGKTLNQCLMLGGGRDKVVSMLGVDTAEGYAIYDAYFEAMGPSKFTPGHLRCIQTTSAQTMRSRGFVYSLLGRRAHLPPPRPGRSDMSYTALNRLLQCGNADMLKVKMVEIDEYCRSEGDRVQLLSNIHDAFKFQFFESDRETFKEASRIMKSFGANDVIKLEHVLPFEIDTHEGQNWAVATYGEEAYKESLAA